jgi:hypothetical protein
VNSNARLGTSIIRKTTEVGHGDTDAAKNALRRNHQRMQSMNAGQNGLSMSPSSDFNFTMNGNQLDDNQTILDPFAI